MDGNSDYKNGVFFKWNTTLYFYSLKVYEINIKRMYKLFYAIKVRI
jgi:hypothetical protein